MASRRPLVNVSGSIRELPTGDTLPGVRELLTAARTYYVRADGSDSNSGLSNTAGGAFATVQKAVDTIANLDLGTQQATIQVADGTYAPFELRSCVGALAPRIVGNTTTPANVLISATAASVNAVRAVNAGAWVLGGLKLQASGSDASGVRAEGRTTITITNFTEFGACASRHMFARGGASIYVAANTRITGTSQTFFEAAYAGSYFEYAGGYTCTIVGNPAVGYATVVAGLCSVVVINAITFSGSATGMRYAVGTNSVIQTFGHGANYFPGDSVGTNDGSGFYA